MIDETGHAVLADFSLMMLIPDQTTFYLYTHSDHGLVQWMGPELFDPEHYGFQRSQLMRESDCYALGMVVYEILSGHLPYGNDNYPAVILKVVMASVKQKFLSSAKVRKVDKSGGAKQSITGKVAKSSAK